MQVLLFGHRGFLGTFLRPLLGPHVTCSNVRLEDTAALERELDTVKPSHVLSCTGRTHGPGIPTVDYLEGGRDKLILNVRDNLHGPLALALACAARGIHCTLITTGCVYHSEYDEAGQALDSFKEGDKPNFFKSSYSIMKGALDQLLSTPYIAQHVLSLRIRLPIFAHRDPRNTLTKLLSYPRLCSLQNSVTCGNLFERCLASLMERKITGPLNFTNPGVVDHRYIIDRYRQYHDQHHVATFITAAELTAALPAGRSNNKLDTTRLESLFPEGLPTAEEAVEAAIRDYHGKK